LDRLFDTDRAALLTEIVVAIGQRFGVAFDGIYLRSELQLSPNVWRFALRSRRVFRSAPSLRP
jgi:hypothetical protein